MCPTISARAAKRKYYLEEEVRNERLTEGGDFVLSGLCEPLKLSDPQARKFVLCLNNICLKHFWKGLNVRFPKLKVALLTNYI